MKFSHYSLGLTVLAAAFTLSSCHEKHEHHTEEVAYQSATPLVTDTVLPEEYVCQIHASRHIELRALEKGYLQDILVDEGQQVSKGQKMFQIVPKVYEAELKRAEAEARLAEIEYENTKQLFEQNVVSSNQLAKALAIKERALAEVDLAKTRLGFTSIHAPFTGMMDHLLVREGSLLDEGEHLTTLSDNSKMWVYFNMPESEYLKYMRHSHSQESKIVRLRLANGEVFSEPGVVETIEGEFDHTTGNIEFRASFPNPNGLLRHGETGNILIDSPFPQAMLIPQKATFQILDRRYVFVIGANGELEQRKIEVAGELDHLFLISDGLHEDEHILIEGIRKVKNGETVHEKLTDMRALLPELDLYTE